MSTNDGGPAFPCDIEHVTHVANHSGMSLRDWFAGQAITALVYHSGVELAEHAAHDAYQMADAMLAEREKNNAG